MVLSEISVAIWTLLDTSKTASPFMQSLSYLAWTHHYRTLWLAYLIAIQWPMWIEMVFSSLSLMAKCLHHKKSSLSDSLAGSLSRRSQRFNRPWLLFSPSRKNKIQSSLLPTILSVLLFAINPGQSGTSTLEMKVCNLFPIPGFSKSPTFLIFIPKVLDCGKEN